MATFKGVRYQRGNGIFGTLMQKAVFPLLKYIGINGFSKMGEFAQEAIANPSAIKEIAKTKLKEAASKALDDGVKRAKIFVQTGKGLPQGGRRRYKGKSTRDSKLTEAVILKHKPQSE